MYWQYVPCLHACRIPSPFHPRRVQHLAAVTLSIKPYPLGICLWMQSHALANMFMGGKEFAVAVKKAGRV